MARCEDFPCCGHENGCCPDYDKGGNQLNMRCICGAILPLSSRHSICESCLGMDDSDDDDEEWDHEPSDEGADAEWLASAGRGTDEDYGYYPDGGDEW